MSNVVMNADRRHWCIDQYDALKNKIANGQLKYSVSALDSDLKAFSFYSNMHVYRWQIVIAVVLYFVLAISFVPLLLILSPVVVGAAAVASIYKWMCTKGYVNYVGICELLEEGSLNNVVVKANEQTNSANNNLADQIAKLYELKKLGALTDDEFEEQKKKLLS